jgi:hypothetical protein
MASMDGPQSCSDIRPLGAFVRWPKFSAGSQTREVGAAFLYFGRVRSERLEADAILLCALLSEHVQAAPIDSYAVSSLLRPASPAPPPPPRHRPNLNRGDLQDADRLPHELARLGPQRARRSARENGGRRGRQQLAHDAAHGRAKERPRRAARRPQGRRSLHGGGARGPALYQRRDQGARRRGGGDGRQPREPLPRWVRTVRPGPPLDPGPQGQGCVEWRARGGETWRAGNG